VGYKILIAFGFGLPWYLVACSYFEIPINFFLRKIRFFLLYLLYLMTDRYFQVIGKILISFGVRQFTYFSGGKIGILEYDKAVYV
jgi:hypothetical protein